MTYNVSMGTLNPTIPIPVAVYLILGKLKQKLKLLQLCDKFISNNKKHKYTVNVSDVCNYTVGQCLSPCKHQQNVCKAEVVKEQVLVCQ